MQGGGLLHQWLLGGWGVMIGEMWDLEGLCEKAVELKRATCFVSSVPLKVSISLFFSPPRMSTGEHIEYHAEEYRSTKMLNAFTGTRRRGEPAECCRHFLNAAAQVNPSRSHGIFLMQED